MQSTSWEVLGWMKHKRESRFLEEISINNLRYADDTTLIVESKEELKNLLMRVKEDSEKASLKKLNIQKTKIMASDSITSQQIEGERWKQWEISSSWAPESLRMVTAAMKSEDDCFFAENRW